MNQANATAEVVRYLAKCKLIGSRESLGGQELDIRTHKASHRRNGNTLRDLDAKLSDILQRLMLLLHTILMLRLFCPDFLLDIIDSSSYKLILTF